MRSYTNEFINIELTSTAVDLATVAIQYGGVMFIERFWCMAVNDPITPAEMLQLEGNVITSATLGNGGGTANAIPIDSSDYPSITTCHQGDTTLTYGGSYNVFRGAMHVWSGIDWTFKTPVPIVWLNAGIVSFALTVPTYTGTSGLLLSGGIQWSEIGAELI